MAGGFHDAFDQLRIQADVAGDVAVKAPADGLGGIQKVFFDIVHIALRNQVDGQALTGIGAQAALNNFFRERHHPRVDAFLDKHRFQQFGVDGIKTGEEQRLVL